MPICRRRAALQPTEPPFRRTPLPRTSRTRGDAGEHIVTEAARNEDRLICGWTLGAVFAATVCSILDALYVIAFVLVIAVGMLLSRIAGAPPRSRRDAVVDDTVQWKHGRLHFPEGRE